MEYNSSMHYRKTWVEIDLGAIHDNLQAYRRYVSPSKQLMAVVKANAYGHGAIPVAKEALQAGATWLAVALLEEAIELRQAGIDAPILLFGYCPEEYIPIAQQHQVTISLNDSKALSRSIPYIATELPALMFHLKVDTGMNRLGLRQEDELKTFIASYQQALNQKVNVQWQGAYTHLATADELDQSYARQQLQEFDQYMKMIRKEGIILDRIHAENSAAAIQFPENNMTNLVRVGISMYGLHPSIELKQQFPFQLKQAFSLHTTLSHVKKVEAHTGISYGLTYKTEQAEWIGTVPIGYADGLLRGFSNQIQALIQGSKVPQVGRICMDQCMLLLDQPHALGTVVTLIGKQGEQEITIDELADALGTINYEIVCLISARVPRIYYKYGQRLRSMFDS